MDILNGLEFFSEPIELRFVVDFWLYIWKQFFKYKPLYLMQVLAK